MKKMILAVASVAMFGSVSYATEEMNTQDLDQSIVVEQEEGAIAPEVLEQLTYPAVLGAVSADEWSGRPTRPGDGRPGYGPGRPGRPGDGRPGRPGYGRPDREVTCFARNARGQMFRATARDSRIAQSFAMRKCEQASRICRPAGCR